MVLMSCGEALVSRYVLQLASKICDGFHQRKDVVVLGVLRRSQKRSWLAAVLYL